jgi:filamentous hemagglutinin
VRNEASWINGRYYTGHALDQMQNRGVVPSVVENALSTGAQFPTRAGTTGFYDAVNKIRVIVNSKTRGVVTVIRGAP